MLQNMSRSDHVAFKVKTTRQKRYLVRPAMGIIEAGTSLSVQFIVPPAEVDALLDARLKKSSKNHSTSSSSSSSSSSRRHAAAVSQAAPAPCAQHI